MSGPLSNDLVHPEPRTDLPPGRTLSFDFPGLEIGVAEYAEGPTGCTVFHFPEDASLAAAPSGVAVHWGSPAALMNSINASLRKTIGSRSRTYFSRRVAAKRSQKARWPR